MVVFPDSSIETVYENTRIIDVFQMDEDNRLYLTRSLHIQTQTTLSVSFKSTIFPLLKTYTMDILCLPVMI